MGESKQAHQMYNPTKTKTILLLLLSIVGGFILGVFEGKINIITPLAGLTIGVLCIVAATNIGTKYTLTDTDITIGMSVFGVTTVSKTAGYDSIQELKWETDRDYHFGYDPFGRENSKLFNIGGNQIRIVRDNGKDIVFSADKKHYDALKDKLEK